MPDIITPLRHFAAAIFAAAYAALRRRCRHAIAAAVTLQLLLLFFAAIDYASHAAATIFCFVAATLADAPLYMPYCHYYAATATPLFFAMPFCHTSGRCRRAAMRDEDIRCYDMLHEMSAMRRSGYYYYALMPR